MGVQAPPARPHGSRPAWTKWVVGLVVLVVLALALGLGLGLGLHHGGDDEPAPSVPIPTGTPNFNGTLLPVRSPWQIVLSETLDMDDQSTPTPNVSVFDIDMFNHQNLTVVKDLLSQGVSVLCYFSAGSYEPDRSDSWRFNDNDFGKELDGWPGEYWLDLNSANVRKIMLSRIEIAAQMNCTGIDPDNVDAYDNENGLGLTQDDSISFVRFLGQEAAARGMMTGLKNAGDIIDDVLDYVQFSVNEQCVQYNECETYAAFTNASKPVFHIEYPDGDTETVKKSFATAAVSKYCDLGVDGMDTGGFNTVLKNMNLNGFVQYCDDNYYTTAGTQ